MQDAASFRDKARTCRRLAANITVVNDPAIAQLKALATEFDEKATLLEASEILARDPDTTVTLQAPQLHPKS